MMLLQQPFQLGQVVVAVADAAGRREAQPVDQAGMDQLVGQQEGLRVADGRLRPILVLSVLEGSYLFPFFCYI